MGWGLLFALFAAACTAGATILQAVGVRHVRRFDAVNPRLLLSVTRSLSYMSGLLLLAAAFVLTLIALRTTALFVVQGLAAASIAAIAAVSAVVFRARLHWVEWSAVAAVCGGVTLLVITQSPSTAPHLPPIGAWAVLLAAVAIAILALTSHTWLNGAAIPGLLAGLAFGDAAVASRMIADLDNSAGALVTSPATYAVVVSGLIGTLLYATALQRGSVTAVFGLATVGQTIGPAVIGWLLLGDSVRPGTAVVAGAGFVLAVVGALVLGRHAQPECMMPEFVVTEAPVPKAIVMPKLVVVPNAVVGPPVDERAIAQQLIAKREAAHQRNVRGLARVVVVLRLVKRVVLLPWRKRRAA
jgi:drug/metabolite transporter (DMT)-like permease